MTYHGSAASPSSGTHEEKLAFWTSRLAALPEGLDLPYDVRGEADVPGATAFERRALPAELSNVLDSGFVCDNADCDALDPDCPGGDCGSCTLLQNRACFPDPMGAHGSDAVAGAVPSASVYGAELVSTLCVPATSNPVVDTSVGLPGPARLLIDFDTLGRCGLNPLASYELPGGSNCP